MEFFNFLIVIILFLIIAQTLRFVRKQTFKLKETQESYEQIKKDRKEGLQVQREILNELKRIRKRLDSKE
ncbi:DUF5320 domain-containing protein [Oceanobacillus bengalensis]|uniref:Uncharacterized protein n=2 Tax=Oceanobacillus bengalensis TaxID=1435466 RepID=A0A494Z042_9BACI|nr:hypothetical protein D8M05_08995 [Oceanobacillus bengalensis]